MILEQSEASLFFKKANLKKLQDNNGSPDGKKHMKLNRKMKEGNYL